MDRPRKKVPGLKRIQEWWEDLQPQSNLNSSQISSSNNDLQRATSISSVTELNKESTSDGDSSSMKDLQEATPHPHATTPKKDNTSDDDASSKKDPGEAIPPSVAATVKKEDTSDDEQEEDYDLDEFFPDDTESKIFPSFEALAGSKDLEEATPDPYVFTLENESTGDEKQGKVGDIDDSADDTESEVFASIESHAAVIAKEALNYFQSGELPGMVLTAEDKSGKLLYAEAFGTASLKEGAKSMELDSTFWLGSVSKFFTTIAALQSVDRGHFTLDEDVTRLLPEFEDIQILKGFDDVTGKPILVPAKTKITLRHLLTHTSGLGHDRFDPALVSYLQYHSYHSHSFQPGKSEKSYPYPLLFEPGTSFRYGVGVDWAGVMTRRANNNVTLEEYIQANICTPLNMTSTTFHLEAKPHVEAKLAGPTMRAHGWMRPNDPRRTVEDADFAWFPLRTGGENGGAGLYSSAPDFQKLLNSLTFNDGKILNPQTVVEMFDPQVVNPKSRRALVDFWRGPQYADNMSRWYGLGADLHFGRFGDGTGAGIVRWTGLTNCFWWADLKRGVSATMFMTLLPKRDKQAADLFACFEMKVDEMLDAIEGIE